MTSPRRRKKAADPDTRYSIRVATQPSEGYLAESPVSSTGHLVAARNAEGDVNLFSVSAKGILHFIRRSATSDTGWDVQKIQKTGLRIKKYLSLAVAQTADLHAPDDPQPPADRVFALIKSATCSLAEIVVTDGVAELVPISPPFSDYFAKRSSVKFGRLEAGVRPGGIVFCTTVKNGTKAQKSRFVVSQLLKGDRTVTSYIAKSDRAGFGKVAPQPVSTETAAGVSVAMHFHPKQSSTRYSAAPGMLTDFKAPSNAKKAGSCTVTTSALPVIEADNIAVATAPSGQYRIVANDPLRSAISTPATSTDAPVAWPEDWSALDTTITGENDESATVAFHTLAAARDGSDRTVIVGAGTTRSPYGLWALTASGEASTGLVGLTRLGTQSLPAIRCDAAGEAHVFAVTALDTLVHFWLAADGHWRSEEVDKNGQVSFTSESTAYKIGTFRSSLTVMDTRVNGPAVVGVMVSAEEELMVEVNGRTHMIGAGLAAGPFQTSALGQLNVSQIITTLEDDEKAPATDGTLSTPPLTFTIVDEVEVPAVEVSPETKIMHLLDDVRARNSNALKNAKYPGNKAVFNEKFGDIDELKQGLRLVSDGLRDCYAAPHSLPAAYRKVKDARGMRFYEGTAKPPRPTFCAPTPWRLDMRSGRPVFSDLAQEEADALIARGKVEGDVVADWMRAEGIFGVDWDDVWTEIRGGIAEFAELAVNAAEATIVFVIDGVEMAITYAVETVSQVWSFISTLLDMFANAWGAVVGWILRMIGGLFGWDDILAQRDACRTMVSDFANDLPGMLPDLEKDYGEPFDIWLDTQKSEIASWAETVNGAYGSDDVKEGNADDKTPADYVAGGDDASWSQSTWLYDKVTVLTDELFPVPTPFDGKNGRDIRNDLAAGATAILAGMTSDIEGTLTDLMENLSTLIGSVADEGVETVSALITLFKDLVIGMIDTGRGLIEGIMAVAQILVDAAPEILNWLDTELSIPFFTSFYEAAVGSTCTLLDIACLLVAIPTTLIAGAGAGAPEGSDPMMATLMGVSLLLAGAFTIAGDIVGATDIKAADPIALALTGLTSVLVALGLKASYDPSKLSIAKFEFWFWAAFAGTVLIELVVSLLKVQEPISDEAPDRLLGLLFFLAMIVQLIGFVYFMQKALNPDDGVVNEAEALGAGMLGVGGIATILRVTMLTEKVTTKQMVVYGIAEGIANIVNLGFHIGIVVADDDAPEGATPA